MNYSKFIQNSNHLINSTLHLFPKNILQYNLANNRDDFYIKKIINENLLNNYLIKTINNFYIKNNKEFFFNEVPLSYIQLNHKYNTTYNSNNFFAINNFFTEFSINNNIDVDIKQFRSNNYINDNVLTRIWWFGTSKKLEIVSLIEEGKFCADYLMQIKNTHLPFFINDKIK
jgi:hypothetical protein